jgi:AbrB family looped-hinge helix DNA binding protein
LWGEIAAGLGRYDDFKEEDLRMMPVRDIGKLKSLFDKPTLILLDELPHYLLNAEAVKVGDTNLCTLTISFILTLISAVSATENSMLIITMTGKQRLYEEYVKRVKRRIDELFVERVDSAIREAFSRQAQYLTPIRKEEVAHVLKKRLIKRIKDPRAVEEIARSYYDYLSRKGLITDLAYEDRIKESYPFHPFLIDILYERVSTIEQFNKTRGIFRLLGLMLHRIYRDKMPCQLLSPGDILLDDLEIMEELTSRLGREWLKTVIEADCIEKARRLDEKRSVKLVERVARTIFLYSLIGAERISGALPRDIKLGACYPGLEPDLVDEVLEEIDREFWYIRSEDGAYYFQTEPNINKIIYDYMSEVRDDEIRETIRKELEKLFSTDREIDRQAKVVIWDRHEDLRARHDALIAEAAQLRQKLADLEEDYSSLNRIYEATLGESSLTKNILFAQTAAVAAGLGIYAVLSRRLAKKPRSPEAAEEGNGEKKIQKILSGRRITIPSDAAARLGIKEGDLVEIDYGNGSIIIRPVEKDPA